VIADYSANVEPLMVFGVSSSSLLGFIEEYLAIIDS
jgi:hypothetical protein